MAEDRKENEKKPPKCSCFVIDSDKTVSPENLLCHRKEFRGYLSDQDEIKYCFDGKFGEKVSGETLDEFNTLLKGNAFRKEKEGKVLIKHPVKDTPEGYEDQLRRMKYDVGLTWDQCMENEKQKEFWECVDEQANIALELCNKTTNELGELLEERGLKKSGTKEEQVNRLREARWEPE